MVGSDQADQRAPGAKSVMMGGGLASLEGGRMEVPRQATVPKPMSASVSHPLEKTDKEREGVKDWETGRSLEEQEA